MEPEVVRAPKTKEELNREREEVETSYNFSLPLAEKYFNCLAEISRKRKKLQQLEALKEKLEKEHQFLTHMRGILKNPKMTKPEKEEAKVDSLVSPEKKRSKVETPKASTPEKRTPVRKSLEKKMAAIEVKNREQGGYSAPEGMETDVFMSQLSK